MPKVSVIVPIYKGNCYIPGIIHMLEKNWESANQAETIEIELVFVNDFPEEKLKVESQWAKNISWNIIENKQNTGIHFSRVQGLLHAKREYILFLDQDDEISPVYIREQLKALAGYDAIICNGKNYSNLIYRDARELQRAVDGREYRKGYNRIVSPGQVLLRREAVPPEWLHHILKRNGADDYFLWLLLFCKKNKVGVQDKVLYWHSVSDGNTSKDGDGMDASVLEMAGKMESLGYLTQGEAEVIRKSRVGSAGKKGISIEEYEKEKKYKEMLELWMLLRERGISVDRFLSKIHLKKIAVYGAGILGRHLYYELKNSGIQVEYFLDKNKDAEIPGVKTIAPGEGTGLVDAVIVTPFLEYTAIREQLKKIYPCKIISVESVLFNADFELMAE